MLGKNVFVCLLLCSAPLVAQSFTLTVNAKGFKSDKGMAEAIIYQDAKAYPTKPDKAVAKVRAPISNGQAALVFKGLTPGVYAVAVYHDQNNNGKLDANFIGIPKEPTGASNDAKGKMGPPSFKDAHFDLSGDMSIVVTMQ